MGENGIVLGFDSLYRRQERSEEGLLETVNPILSQQKMALCGTLCEQFGGIHLNATLTGVAIASGRSDGRE